MRKDYEKLFTYLVPPEVPEGLFNRIMARIKEEERLIAVKRRVIIFSAASVFSLAALVTVFSSMQSALAQSGLPQFFSLVFSDPQLVFASWNDFALSILEALPALSISAFLTAVFVFFVSLKFLARDATTIFA